MGSPCNGVYKLNTYESAINNAYKTGGGGILRDNQGKLMYAFVNLQCIGTYNQGDVKAAIHGVTWSMNPALKFHV